MQAMIDILLTILPVFLIMGAGYASAKSGYLPVTLAEPLNAFTVKLAVPALLFRAMYLVDFGDAFNGPMLASFYAAAMVSFLSAIALARGFFKRRPGEAVAVGFCALFSNSLLLGLPILERAHGSQALPPALAIVAFHAGIMYALGMTFMEFSRADGRPLGQTIAAALRAILSNVLMIASLSGVAFNLLDIPLPGPLLDAMGLLAAAAIPAALVGIGATLTRYKLTSGLGEVAMVTVCSLVIHPLGAFLLAHHVFALEPPMVRAAVIIAAMPPGMNAYIFAAMYNRAIDVAASSILFATTVSVASITFWIWLLEHAL